MVSKRSEEKVWMLGCFGSSMDMDVLEKKKGVKVLAHIGAIARGWRMAFNMKGMPVIEPWFDNSKLHGVAFQLTLKDKKHLE